MFYDLKKVKIIAFYYIMYVPPGSDSVEWNSDDRNAKVGENQVNQ